MRKLAALLVAIVVVVALGGYAAYERWFSVHRIDLPLVEPVGNPLAQISHSFPARQSQVVVTARIPFAKIRELADKAIPSRIQGEYGLPDSGGLSGIVAKPKVSRDPLNLNPEVNSGPPRIQLGLRLHGPIDVRAFKWIIINLPLKKKLKTKSPEASGTLNLAANIHGWISPGIDPHWNMTHQEHFDIDVNNAEFKLYGLIPFDLRHQVQDAVNRSAPGIIKSALDSIRDRLAIRPEIERVWKQMFQPIKISSNPNAYVLLNPAKVRLQKITFDDPYFLTIRVSLDGAIVTAILTQAPMGAPPTRLPDLAFEPSISPKFRVFVPLGVEFSEINESLKGQLGNQKIELDRGVTVVVSDIGLYSKNGNLYVKMNVDAENKGLLKRVVGTVFLKCGVAYDPGSQQLHLKDVDFSVESKDVLAEFAAWLLKGTICRRIQESVKVDIGPRLNEFQRAVNDRYASILIAPGVKLEPHLSQCEFEGLKVEDNLLVAGFDLSGELSCDISIPEK